MKPITLRYATTTTIQGQQGAGPETTEGTVRVSLAQAEIIVDDGEEVRRVGFERGRVTTLCHGPRTVRDSALLGYVHDREAGMASAIHVMRVLRAGGAMLDAAVWQAEAAYGLSWPFDKEELEVACCEVEGDWRWSLGERELARVTPVAAPPPIPSKGLLRLSSFALRVHPSIAVGLAQVGTLPQVLMTDDHFPLGRRSCRYMLESIDEGALDFEAMAQGHAFEPPADATLALIGKPSEGRPPDSRLDDARDVGEPRSKLPPASASTTPGIASPMPIGCAPNIRSSARSTVSARSCGPGIPTCSDRAAPRHRPRRGGAPARRRAGRSRRVSLAQGELHRARRGPSRLRWCAVGELARTAAQFAVFVCDATMGIDPSGLRVAHPFESLVVVRERLKRFRTPEVEVRGLPCELPKDSEWPVSRSGPPRAWPSRWNRTSQPPFD